MVTSFGGKLQGVSLGSFLQMAQMDCITCTLKVNSADETGYLYLLQGELVSAEVGNLENLDAVYRLISWDETVIEIQDSCEKTENQINQPMMNILMEGSRLKDEALQIPEEEHVIEPSEFDYEEASFSETPSEIPAGPDPNSTTGQPQSDPGDSNSPQETPRFKITRKWKFILLGLVFLLIAGGATSAYLINSARQERDSYESLLTAISTVKTPQQKILLLNNYLHSSPDKPYAEQARKKIDALKNNIIYNEFKTLEKTTEEFINAGAFEDAIAAYDSFQKKNPRNKYTQEIMALKTQCTLAIESRHFARMLDLTFTMGPERIEKYKAFLKQYPKSRHTKKILDLIAHMEEEFYVYLERQIVEGKKSENWQECILLSQKFIDAYPKSKHTDNLKRFQAKCQEKIHTSAEFDRLVQQANRHGQDWRSALIVFSDYLKAYPNTLAKEKIEKQIKRLNDVLEVERRSAAVKEIATLLAASDSRFIVSNGTFKDKKTGLTWSLLDSQAELNECLAYNEAVSYVDTLKTGGHDDWRLASPAEVSGLYKKKPFFPSVSGQWYWTSKSIKRYVEQWIIDVEVIMPNEAGDLKQIQKESWECGTVRAVRGRKK